MTRHLACRRSLRRIAGTSLVVLLAAVVATFGLAGCSSGGDGRVTVTLVTHDSFSVAKDDLRAFERAHDVDVKILKAGDAGAALNQVILTKGAPLGDAMFGVDNTFLTRATHAGVFAPYTPAALSDVDPAFRLDPSHELVPVDHGDVCVNYDRAALAAHDVPPPTSLDDLTASRYRGMLVVENPATSSTGLAFLLATVARYGDGWRDWWAKLRANDVRVRDGWDQAYFTDFAGGGQQGTYPLVVSYASSPPDSVTDPATPADAAPVATMLDGCFRQVEFAGVLRGARHPALGRALVDWMLTKRFQDGVAESMYVYPVVAGATVPERFAKYAPVPSDPLTLAPGEIARNRNRWIDEWTDTVVR